MGTFPTQVGQATGLTSIAANNNNFNGSIPTQIALLSLLTDLWVSFTHLSLIHEFQMRISF